MAAAAAAATAAALAAHLLKQETNNQTPFSRHSRNGKTPPNFVPKMTQNQLQEQVPGDRNVPSEILLETLSYPAILLEI